MENISNLLSNKNILITGGGSGMGRAITQKMADLGACIAICGRREDALGETVDLV